MSKSKTLNRLLVAPRPHDMGHPPLGAQLRAASTALSVGGSGSAGTRAELIRSLSAGNLLPPAWPATCCEMIQRPPGRFFFGQAPRAHPAIVEAFIATLKPLTFPASAMFPLSLAVMET